MFAAMVIVNRRLAKKSSPALQRAGTLGYELKIECEMDARIAPSVVAG